MNVAKHWALTIMLTSLAFAHFLTELLLKEQLLVIPVNRTFNDTGHIDAKLIDISKVCQKKKSNKIGCISLIVSQQSIPAEYSRKIGRFFRELAPENLAKFSSFFCDLSEAVSECIIQATKPTNKVLNILYS